jgi:hypothetical protein
MSNLFNMNNVRKSKDDGTLPHKCRSSDLDSLISDAARANPLWTFTPVRTFTNSSDEVVVSAFHIEQDGTLLGGVCLDYVRGNNGVRLTNDRIQKTKSSGRGVFTSDMKKAAVLLRKFFSAPSMAERVIKANGAAIHALDKALRMTTRTHQGYEHPLNTRMLNYVRNEGMMQFAMHLRTTHDTEGLALIEKTQVAEHEMMTVQDVRDAFNANKTSMVVVVDKNYVVKTGDNVQLYDDNTLPEHLRGKLGMLKLVEPEAVVTGIGCRVSVDAFVIVNDEPQS